MSGSREFHTKVASILAAAVAMTIAGAALAQQPPTPADAPQRTSATYADWIVECEMRPGPPPQKICEMAQVTQLQGKTTPFSRVAVAHPVKDQPVRLVVQTPVNASFAAKVRIQMAVDDPDLAAPFARCVPAGCFAEFDIKGDTLKRFRAAAGSGKVTFADAGGRDVTVPLSFKGFDQAFDALSKE